MDKKAHSQRKHALLSPSGAHRWLNCSPSARLEEEFGVNESSVYANEGTLAHEIADLIIERDLLGTVNDAVFNQKLENYLDNELFQDEMLDHVDTYVSYCREQFIEAKVKTPDAVLFNERKINLTKWIEDGFGATDCTIIADGVLEVIDLKYGKGVAVSAIANKQLMLYGLGAYDDYSMMYDIKVVRLTIVQPRLNSISSWDIPISDLLDWADSDLIPGAKKAFSGEGELRAGDWCKFCKVKNRCKALADENLKIAKYDFKTPQLLTDEDIADIIKRAPMLVEWANSISSYALQKALTEDKQWPGYKVVEGMSRRKWLDEQKVVQVLYNINLSEEDVYNMKLKTITEIEKMLGKKKFAEVLSDVVIKPQGKPALVPDTDKRPPYKGQAILDFAEDID